MKIVADHDLGDLKAEEDRPAVVQWRWYDSRPMLPLWGVLVLLLVVPRKNRRWQIWLILVAPLLAATSRWVIPIESAGLDLMLQWTVAFTIAWTSVWLLAPYLYLRTRLATFASALAVMFGVGIIGYLGYFGVWFDPETAYPVLVFWSIGGFFMLLALMLSGACSRRHFRPGLVAAWLMLWLPVVTAIGMGITVMFFGVIVGGHTDMANVLFVLPMVAFGSLMMSALLYLVNLPVLVLAGFTDDYRQRLQGVVCRTDVSHPENTGGNPFQSE